LYNFFNQILFIIPGVFHDRFKYGEHQEKYCKYDYSALKRKEESEKKIIVTSKSHNDKTKRSLLKKIENTDIWYRGGCGFKNLLLIENKVDYFLHASEGYKRYSFDKINTNPYLIIILN
jgi:3'-phosphoadenosine 5'-phosphosulfate (PAPS) 3'-phosphatase